MNKKIGLKFLWNMVWTEKKSLIVLITFNALLLAIAPMFELIIQRTFISVVENNQYLNKVKVLLFIIIALVILMRVIYPFFKNKYELEIIKFRLERLKELQTTNLFMDYQHTENTTVRNRLEVAKNAVFNNQLGVEGILRSSVSFTAGIISIFLYTLFLLKVSIIFVILIFIITLFIYYLSYKISVIQYAAHDKISNQVRVENYYLDVMADFNYGKDIRMFKMEKFILSKFEMQLNQHIESQREVQSKVLKIKILRHLITAIKELILLIILIYLVYTGSLSIAEFYFYYGIFNMFSFELANILESLAHMIAQDKLIIDYMHMLELDGKCDQRSINVEHIDSIEFKDVYFKYPETNDYVFKGLNFKINRGEKVGIVGLNGSGKTTLAKLLLNFYDVEQGVILVNGIDLKLFNKETYLKQVSSVFQDFKIFALTVAENIMTKEIFKKEELELVLNRVKLADKVSTLTNNENTNLTKYLFDDGIELSGGEYQKLVFARALQKSAQLIVLDEPTSALDPLAEEQLYEEFEDLMIDKTAVFISHRLASTKFCDYIILLENGTVIETGTHVELLTLDKRYAELFRVQADNYREVI